MLLFGVPLVAVERKVERRRFASPDPELGLPYLDECREVQRLVARVRILGVAIWRRVEGEEEIPDWYLAQVGATGDRSGWTSRFAAHIR